MKILGNDSSKSPGDFKLRAISGVSEYYQRRCVEGSIGDSMDMVMERFRVLDGGSVSSDSGVPPHPTNPAATLQGSF